MRASCIVLLAALAPLAGIAARARAGEIASLPAWPAPGTSWSRLTLEARKAIFKGSVELRSERKLAADVAPDLRDCPEGDARKPDGEACVFSLATKASFHADGARTTWADARGLLQDDGREGKRHSFRRFTTSGFHQWKQKGKAAVQERHVILEQPAAQCIVDMPLLLWLATGLRLDREGAEMHVSVVSKGRLIPLALEAQETDTIEVASGSEVAVRRVRIRSSDEEHDASLFGLSGDVDLYLALDTGLPVELRGHVAKLGAVRVRVTSAVRESDTGAPDPE